MRKVFSVFACLATLFAADLHGQSTPVDVPSGDGTYELSAVERLPRLRNASTVARGIIALYPPALRDAGIDGQVVLKYRIGEDGKVDPATIEVVSATDVRFFEPARQVVARMVFAPALVNGRPVKVWVQQPLVFTVD